MEPQNYLPCSIRSRDSSVGIETRLHAGWPKNRGSILGRDRYLLPIRRWEFLCGPPSILGCQKLFSWGWSDRSLKLTTHLHLSAEDINAWSSNSAPPYAVFTWCFFKHRVNFIVTWSIRCNAEADKSSSLLTTYLPQIRVNIILPSKSTPSGFTLFLRFTSQNFECLLTWWELNVLPVIVLGSLNAY
jgi:hypothetical protein